MVKSMKSVVRGYCVFMNFRYPSIGDKFALEIDKLNIHNQYAVATKVDGLVKTRKPRFYAVISRAPFWGLRH